MKKIIIVLLISMIAVSCNEEKKDKENLRYTQDSEQINVLKAAIKDYVDADWEAMKKHYADTAKIFHNTKDGISISQVVQNHQQQLEAFSDYGLVSGEDEFEMVVTDDGNTWVNYWGDWKATVKGTDTEIIVPIHLTAQYENGKIVREYGYWDNGIVMTAMQEMDMAMKQQDSIQNAETN
ncbi:nuclear transport factor 2 family protein [Christiangramia sabulilitoris]|uniref:Nuclear transport factor 2 family protein n=1 Tax=Christiangramia sabulilitoris TaxID=2583991 RepID=A0A550I6Z7_9FLAO|nr:nuclear transport factor 2 family protein [Christiangramia sabulilitoris]TRO66747.1 nuclear transport factor 2 family protein [Christiangramia sabulilitoris]